MNTAMSGDFIVAGGLARLLEGGEQWLAQRTLEYAKRQGFTRYTSTLAEAWRLSISGLTASLVTAVAHFGGVPEHAPEQEADPDPVAAFALEEAARHRARGVTLFMFLGLYKYYRQSYLDLLEQAALDEEDRRLATMFVARTFERIEIALCSAWTAKTEAELLGELQRANRVVTNEKNAYLTVFESLHSPVILLDESGRVWTLNHEASKLVRATAAPGAAYYGGEASDSLRDGWHLRGQAIETLFPWLPSTRHLLAEEATGEVFECASLDGLGTRVFEGRVSRLLDVSEKLVGTVIILNDVTEHKELAERLDRLARTDGLTETNNRRHFLELARQEALRASRYSRDLSVLVIDVDHFKTVNDTYGHATGDDLLVAFARTMLGTLRATDILGRLGGEEFAILLPETSEDAGMAAAERVRARVEQTVVRTATGLVHGTVSIGVATLDPSDPTLDGLLSRADGALYRAKALGRNVVVAASQGRLRQESGIAPTAGLGSEARSADPLDAARVLGNPRR